MIQRPTRLFFLAAGVFSVGLILGDGADTHSTGSTATIAGTGGIGVNRNYGIWIEDNDTKLYSTGGDLT